MLQFAQNNPIWSRNTYDIELVETDVTFSMLLFDVKHFRCLWLGCTIAFLQQVSGRSPVIQFASYLGMTSKVNYNSNIAIAVCNTLLTLFSVLILQKYGRKSILMVGFLFWCLCNTIIFQMFDQDVNIKMDLYIATIRWLLYTSIFVFVVIHAFCLSPVLWVYLAETLPPRALGIAAWVHWLTKFFVFYIPYLLVQINTDERHLPTQYNMYLSSMFFFYSWFCIIGYFIVLVFVQETKDMTKNSIKKVYEDEYYDTMTRSILKSSSKTGDFEEQE